MPLRNVDEGLGFRNYSSKPRCNLGLTALCQMLRSRQLVILLAPIIILSQEPGEHC